MAERGTSKYWADLHEKHIAFLFNGKQSRSSGAAEHDAGDVRQTSVLIECKATGNPGKLPKRAPRFLTQLEKIANEAWQEGKDPALALRYYRPTSALANHEGWVDVVLMRAVDAAEREKYYSKWVT